jgi:hypothetical protein
MVPSILGVSPILSPPGRTSTMVDDDAREAGDDIPDGVTTETGFRTIWTLLWLIMRAERHAVALAIIGDQRNHSLGAESRLKWAEPQRVAFMRDEDVPTIPWQRAARLLRNHLWPIEGCPLAFLARTTAPDKSSGNSGNILGRRSGKT